MLIERLPGLSQLQRDRLAYIDLRVCFVGEIRRQDLVSRFGIQSAAATRDLALYKELVQGNIEYDLKAKSYVVGRQFNPVFTFSIERLFSWMSQGFGDGEPTAIEPSITSEIPARLSLPNLEILAIITRSIHKQKPIQIVYYSLSSGETLREIVPFALVDNGLRWHVRAFDRLSGEFRDFVITRIAQAKPLEDSAVLAHEKSDRDIQWTRIVEVELIAHPDAPRPEVAEMDFAMVDGVLKMKLRAATAGYILRQWSVDCSPDHSLRGPEYRLWLKDPLALYGVKTAVLAPGYVAPGKREL